MSLAIIRDCLGDFLSNVVYMIFLGEVRINE